MRNKNIDPRLYDAQWMRQAYAHKTIADIAQELHVQERTIQMWLMRHKIQRRSKGQRIHKTNSKNGTRHSKSKSSRTVAARLRPDEFESVLVLALFANRSSDTDDRITDGLRYAIHVAKRVVGCVVKGDVASLAEMYGGQAEGALWLLNALIETADKEMYRDPTPVTRA